MERRKALADFLRHRRITAEPSRLGIVPGPRRRTPGLRREELAHRAGVSVDWYVRLEQGRDVRPSRETLDAIAGALRLDEDERGHLFFLGRDEEPPRRRPAAEAIDESLARALPLLAGVPAMVLGRRFDILARNAELCRLYGFDPATLPVEQRNTAWLMFCDPRMRLRYADWSTLADAVVAFLRNVWAHHADDPDMVALVEELAARSEEFRERWARHDVRAKSGGRKAFSTEVGALDLEWHTLRGARDVDQHLVFFAATPGSEDETRLRRLLG